MPPGPILLIEPSGLRLQAAFGQYPGRDMLCVSAEPDHLTALREQAGPAERVVFFAGGIGRLISLIAVGWPHPAFVVLMAIELILPPLLIWLWRGARKATAV